MTYNNYGKRVCCLIPVNICCVFISLSMFLQSVYQISSESSDKWPTYSISLNSKMAVAAILENGGTLPVLCF
jgi:hypothetical protein